MNTGRRLRADATWNRMTMEQQDALESWLFEDRIPFAKAQAQLKEQFGLETSLMAVQRIYHHRARERHQLEMMRTLVSACDVDGMPVPTEVLCAAAVRAVGAAALNVARNHPEKVKELGYLTRVLLHNEDARIRRHKLDAHFYHTVDSGCLSETQKKLVAIWATPGLTEEEKLAQSEALQFGEAQGVTPRWASH